MVKDSKNELKEYKIYNKNKIKKTKNKKTKKSKTYKTIKDSHIHTALKNDENAMKTMKMDFKSLRKYYSIVLEIPAIAFSVFNGSSSIVSNSFDFSIILFPID